VGYSLVNDSSRRQVASPVHITLLSSEKSHVVSLRADDEGDLGLVIVASDLSSSITNGLELLADSQ
jgi:hypothetical protein